MLEISILTLLLYEIYRKSSHVIDIDSDCCYTRPASLLERAVMLEISILTLLLCETCIVIRKSSHVRDIDSDSVAMRDLHRY